MNSKMAHLKQFEIYLPSVIKKETVFIAKQI